MSTKEYRPRNDGTSPGATPREANADRAAEFNLMLESGQHLLHTWQMIGDEIRQLTQRNIEDGIKAARALNGSTDPRHAFELQMDFWRDATRNYAQTAQTCMTLAARGASDGYTCLASAPQAVFGTCQGWATQLHASDAQTPRASA